MKRVFCEYHYFSYGNEIITYAEFLGVGDDMTAKIRLIDGTETENAGDVICVEFYQLDFVVSDETLLDILAEYDEEEPLSETGKEVLLYLKGKEKHYA